MPAREFEVSGEWKSRYIDELTGGLDKTKRPDALDDSQLDSLRNIHFLANRLVVDTGYKTFFSGIEGTPRFCVQFYQKNGSSTLLCLTNTRLYKRENDEWQYVSNGTSTAANGGEPAGETNLVVDSIAGFSSGDVLGVILDDGNQHQTTINGAPSGSTIVMTDAVPTGRTIPDDAAVVKATVLTGQDTHQPSGITLPSHDWFVFTNNADNVKRYNGSTCEDVPNLPSSGNTQARAVAIFHNALMLLGTTEGGTAYPQRIRWADIGDPTNWTTGTANYEELLDSEDFIQGGFPLGPYLIIYREKTISRLSYVGEADLLFLPEPTIPGEGVLSHDSVIEFEDHHIFVGNSNIYEYRGGFDLKPLARAVYDEVFGRLGDLNRAAKQQTAAVYIEETDEIWVFYATTGNTYQSKLLRYNRGIDSWSHRVFAKQTSGFGFYQKDSSKTWQQMEGSWLEHTQAWSSITLLANSPTTLLCGVDGQIYEYDYVSITDAGTAIDWFFETKVFQHPGFNIRHDAVSFSAVGYSVKVFYRTSEKGDWKFLKELSLSSEYKKYSINKQFISRKWQYRFEGSQGGFNLQWLSFTYRLEDEELRTP